MAECRAKVWIVVVLGALAGCGRARVENTEVLEETDTGLGQPDIGIEQGDSEPDPTGQTGTEPEQSDQGSGSGDMAELACEVGTDSCAANATCIESEGGSSCSCDAGFDDGAGDASECWSIPSAPVLSKEDDSGVVGDSRTRVFSDLTLSGQGEPGATVGLYLEGTSDVLADTTVAPDGHWEVTVDLFDAGADEETTFSVVARTEPRGNGSTTPSLPYEFVIDRLAPVPPSSTTVRVSLNNPPTFSWIGNETGIFRVALDSEPDTSSAVVDGPSFTPEASLALGIHILEVQERDAAGNWSESLAIQVDVVPAELNARLGPGFLSGGVFDDTSGGQVTELDAGGANIVSGSNPEFAGEQATISTQNSLERESDESLVYRAVVQDLTSEDPAFIGDGVEMRSFLGFVSGVAVNPDVDGFDWAKLPFFEPDAVLLTVEADLGTDSGGIVSLDTVSFVLSAKQGQASTEVNSIGSRLAAWTLEEVPLFPLTVELVVNEVGIVVRVFDAVQTELDLGGNQALAHDFGPGWLTGAFAVLGAENVAERAGAGIYESISVYRVSAKCDDVNGVFPCVCEAGFAGSRCTNIDECSEGTDTCSPDAVCTDTDGGFTCACKRGYEGDGTVCLNIDECAAETNNCAAEATCTDTEGSYTCECQAGFSGDGTVCTNIDECSEGTDTCSPDAVCTDTDGGFTCACNAGFDDANGDGSLCWLIPSTPELDVADDSGIVGDNVTNLSSELTFSGSGEPGVEVSLQVTGEPDALGTTTVDSGGRWRVTVASLVAPDDAESSYALVAQSVSTDGATTPSAPLNLLIDRAAPAIPENLTGTFSLTSPPIFSWQGTETGIFRFALGVEPTGLVGVESTMFTPDTTLENGTYTLFVQEADAAANWSESLAIVVDVIVPVLHEPFDPNFLTTESPMFDDLSGGQVKDFETGTAVAISSANAVAAGEQAFIASTSSISRPNGKTLVYRAVVSSLSAEDTDFISNDENSPETRSFFGAVSGGADRDRIPFFEADAAILIIEGDFRFDTSDIALAGVSFVLSEKQGSTNAIVNSQDSVQASWTLDEVPAFPLTVELSINASELSVRVLDANNLELALNGSSTTIAHAFGASWLAEDHVILGAENVSGLAGAARFDSLTVYEK